MFNLESLGDWPRRREGRNRSALTVTTASLLGPDGLQLRLALNRPDSDLHSDQLLVGRARSQCRYLSPPPHIGLDLLA